MAARRARRRQAAAGGGPSSERRVLATVAGFAVFALTPSPLVRSFGLLLVIGIAMAFLVALTGGLAALGLSAWRGSAPAAGAPAARRTAGVNDRLQKTGVAAIALALASPRRVLAAPAASTRRAGQRQGNRRHPTDSGCAAGQRAPAAGAEPRQAERPSAARPPVSATRDAIAGCPRYGGRNRSSGPAGWARARRREAGDRRQTRAPMTGPPPDGGRCHGAWRINSAWPC